MRHWVLYVCRALLVLGIIPPPLLNAQEEGRSTVNRTVPFELLSNFLVVVRGQIGNLDGLKLILDTGTTNSVIDWKVAEKLRLQRHPGKVMNFVSHIPVEWADVPELGIGPIRAEAVRVMVVRLAEYSELAENADGIIGLDLLGRSDALTIDYEKRLISFRSAEHGIDHPDPPPCFKVPIVVQGLDLHLVVDTGFQGILLYRDRLRKRLPLLRTEGESTIVTMRRTQATRVKLPGVRIGGPEETITVVMMDGPDERTLPGVDGYLGPAALHAKRIEFDFAARVLRWE